MKLCLSAAACLLLLVPPCLSQLPCRQATSTTLERNSKFTVVGLVLPSPPRSEAALAVISNRARSAGAYVFSLSKLAGSDPEKIVDMMPAAVRLATEGHSSILLQRTVTWPTNGESAEMTQAQTLCAEQWLSVHARTKPNDWTFIGPREEIPTLAQVQAVGDNTSMTFIWGFPVAGYGDDGNTEKVLRYGIVNTIVSLTNSHEDLEGNED